MEKRDPPSAAANATASAPRQMKPNEAFGPSGSVSASAPKDEGSRINSEGASDGRDGPMEDGFSIDGFQAMMAKLGVSLDDNQRKTHEFNQQSAELIERQDQQQQSLVSSQMQVEQLSEKLQTEVQGREDLQQRLQFSSQIVESLTVHLQGSSNAHVQLADIQVNFNTELEKILEKCDSLKVDVTSANDYLEKVQKLQQAIELEEKKGRDMTVAFENACSLEAKRHAIYMAGIHSKLSELKKKTEIKTLELEEAKAKNHKTRETHANTMRQWDETIRDLQEKKKTQEESYETSKKAFTEADMKKASLTSQLNDCAEELKEVNDRILELEEEQIQCFKRREASNQKSLEVQMQTNDVLMELQSARSQNSELREHLQNSRVKLDASKEKGKCTISELQEALDKVQKEASSKILELKCICKEVSQTIETKLSKVESLKKSADIKMKIISKLEKDKKRVKSENSVRANLLAEKKTEFLHLSKEILGLSQDIIAEANKKSEAEEMLQKTEAIKMETLKLTQIKLENTKQNIEKISENFEKKRTLVDLMRAKYDKLLADSQLVESSINEKITSDSSELERELEKLKHLREKLIQENKQKWKDLHEEILQQENLLFCKDNEISEANRSGEEIKRELESQQIAINNLELDIKVDMETENELKLRANNLQEEVLGINSKLSELGSELQRGKDSLQKQLDELKTLKQTILKSEDSKVNTLATNSKENQALIADTRSTKQNCETISNEVCCLQGELDEIKRCTEAAQKQCVALEKIIENWSKETMECNAMLEKKKKELEKLRSDCESFQSKIKNCKRDTASHNHIYQRLCKAIKNKKQQTAGTSTRNAAVDNSQRSTGSTEVAAEKNDTPHSILKIPEKPPTPLSERRRVSFIADQDSDDIASSSSTIDLTAELVSEIERNPGAMGTIVARKIAEKSARKLE